MAPAASLSRSLTSSAPTGNLVLGGVHGLGWRAAVDKVLGVPKLVAETIVTNECSSLGHLARRRGLGGTRVAGRPIELLLERVQSRLEIALLFVHALRLLTASRGVGNLGQFARSIARFILAARDLVRLPDGVRDIALGAPGLILLQPAFGLLQPLQRRSRLCGRIAVAACRGAAHGIGRLLQLPCGFLKVGPVLLARQAL